MLHAVHRRRLGRFVGINEMTVARCQGDILPFMFEHVHESTGVKGVRTQAREQKEGRQ